jgi:hypothetical protein
MRAWPIAITFILASQTRRKVALLPPNKLHERLLAFDDLCQDRSEEDCGHIRQSAS